MKTQFALGLAIVASIGSMAMAGEPEIFIPKDQQLYGGLMPQCISADGNYICGSSYIWAGFVADWRQNQTKVFLNQDGSYFEDYGCDLPFVSNSGTALGSDDRGPIKIDFNTGTIERLKISGMIDSMTEDGSIMVGMTPNKTFSDFGDPHDISYQACYWENGEMHLLPVPTEEELGYYYLRTRARCISGDGSVIMGEIVDRLYLLPMILWYRQPDGSYKLDAVCEKYFSDTKYNDGSYKEYVTFRGMALSHNGKWVAMALRDAPKYGEMAQAFQELALYNVETGVLTKASTGELNGYVPEGGISVYYNGISDEGTVVGYYSNELGGESAFIMHASDMTLVNFVDAFDTVGTLADYEDEGINRPSAISADGRYITGYGWMNDFYQGYVLDAGESESGIAVIEYPENGETLYYSISGQRLLSPTKGICIKVADGKASKLVIP